MAENKTAGNQERKSNEIRGKEENLQQHWPSLLVFKLFQ
jgi:hypothetical protein